MAQWQNPAAKCKGAWVWSLARKIPLARATKPLLPQLLSPHLKSICRKYWSRAPGAHAPQQRSYHIDRGLCTAAIYRPASTANQREPQAAKESQHRQKWVDLLRNSFNKHKHSLPQVLLFLNKMSLIPLHYPVSGTRLCGCMWSMYYPQRQFFGSLFKTRVFKPVISW